MTYRECIAEGCTAFGKTRSMCPKHYLRWWKYGDMYYTKQSSPDATPDERLRKAGWTVTPQDCWEINTYAEKFGYGRFRVKGKNVFAHRLAYEAWIGSIPEGYVVRHKCDNPPCVNPEHLEVGTREDNNEDRRKRHRTTLGERHHSAKLTAVEVKDIRSEYSQGHSCKELAARYGVCASSISKVVLKKSWKNLGY